MQLNDCLKHLSVFQLPGWTLVTAAVGLFVYQALDAIDGKQARRTGSATPLGELFDHGCDSLSTGEKELRQEMIHVASHRNYSSHFYLFFSNRYHSMLYYLTSVLVS